MSETQEYKNIPYVAKYDEKGKKIELENGIVNPFPNRKERRAKDSRFRGNKKGVSLTVFNNGKGSAKYKRTIQVITNPKTGKISTVNHYKQV